MYIHVKKARVASGVKALADASVKNATSFLRAPLGKTHIKSFF